MSQNPQKTQQERLFSEFLLFLRNKAANRIPKNVNDNDIWLNYQAIFDEISKARDKDIESKNDITRQFFNAMCNLFYAKKLNDKNIDAVHQSMVNSLSNLHFYNYFEYIDAAFQNFMQYQKTQDFNPNKVYDIAVDTIGKLEVRLKHHHDLTGIPLVGWAFKGQKMDTKNMTINKIIQEIRNIGIKDDPEEYRKKLKDVLEQYIENNRQEKGLGKDNILGKDTKGVIEKTILDLKAMAPEAAKGAKLK